MGFFKTILAIIVIGLQYALFYTVVLFVGFYALMFLFWGVDALLSTSLVEGSVNWRREFMANRAEKRAAAKAEKAASTPEPTTPSPIVTPA